MAIPSGILIALIVLMEAGAAPLRVRNLSAWPEGSEVVIEGQVTGRAVVFPAHAHLPLRDVEGSAIVLEAPEFMFERVAPGDRLEVRGILAMSGGMPVLRPVQLTTLNNTAPPTPRLYRAGELQRPSALGHTVRVEGRVMAIGEDAWGQYLVLDDRQPEPYPIYLPRRGASGLAAFHVGDRVEAMGIASRDGKFRLEVPEAGAIVLVSRGWIIPPRQFLFIAISLAVSVSWWWHRRRRARLRHRTIRVLNAISEDLLSATSLAELARKIDQSLPVAAAFSQVTLYRYDRAHERLENIAADGETIDPAAKHEGALEQAVALCFRNRTPLRVADAQHSPLFWRSAGTSRLRRLIVLPAQARDELVGVLSLSGRKQGRRLSSEELAALQHLGNQAAIVCKQIEQGQRREQLLRSEKLAATGQLMRGVAGELREPLDSILALAQRLLELGNQEARPIVTESMRAAAILSRMGEAASPDEDQAQPADLNHAISQAVDRCRRDWLELAVEITLEPHPGPLWVQGSAMQLEQALRNLVSLAARAALDSTNPAVKVDCSLMARRAVIAIEYTSAVCLEDAPAFTEAGDEVGALGLGVCRGIVQGNGGELGLERARDGRWRIEVSLPSAFSGEPGAQAAGQARPARPFTALLLEPEIAVQRRLVSVWAAHGHRAMPVANESEAIELLGRIRVDVVFCAVRVGQMSWVEIFDHIRDRAPAFVLLSEGMGSDEAALFPEQDGMLLRKPVDAGEVGRLVERIAAVVESGAPARA